MARNVALVRGAAEPAVRETTRIAYGLRVRNRVLSFGTGARAVGYLRVSTDEQAARSRARTMSTPV